MKRGSLGETYFLKIANKCLLFTLFTNCIQVVEKIPEIRPKIYGLNNVAM